MGCCASRDQDGNDVNTKYSFKQKDKPLTSKLKNSEFVRQMKEEADKSFKAFDQGKNGSISINQATNFIKQFCLKHDLPEPSKEQIKIAADNLELQDVNGKNYQELVIAVLQILAADESKMNIKLAK